MYNKNNNRKNISNYNNFLNYISKYRNNLILVILIYTFFISSCNNEKAKIKNIKDSKLKSHLYQFKKKKNRSSFIKGKSSLNYLFKSIISYFAISNSIQCVESFNNKSNYNIYNNLDIYNNSVLNDTLLNKEFNLPNKRLLYLPQNLKTKDSIIEPKNLTNSLNIESTLNSSNESKNIINVTFNLRNSRKLLTTTSTMNPTSESTLNFTTNFPLINISGSVFNPILTDFLKEETILFLNYGWIALLIILCCCSTIYGYCHCIHVAKHDADDLSEASSSTNEVESEDEIDEDITDLEDSENEESSEIDII